MCKENCSCLGVWSGGIGKVSREEGKRQNSKEHRLTCHKGMSYLCTATLKEAQTPRCTLTSISSKIRDGTFVSASLQWNRCSNHCISSILMKSGLDMQGRLLSGLLAHSGEDCDLDCHIQRVKTEARATRSLVCRSLSSMPCPQPA